MHIPATRTVSVCLLSMVLLLSGCSTSGTDIQTAEHSSTVPVVSTVLAEKRQIVPTFSAKATVEQSRSFVLSTSQHGAFQPAVKVNDSVKANQVLGWSNGTEIKSPVDAVVRKAAEASADVPMYYPVFELEYQGFALAVDASLLLSVAPIDSLTGKFQIENGLGPTNIQAIVASPGDQALVDGESTAATQNTEFHISNAAIVTTVSSQNSSAALGGYSAAQMQLSKTGAEQQSRPRVASHTLLCLIGKDQPVRPGQVATVVLTGQAKADVLALPVSAVAGRMGKGAVTLMKDGNSSVVEVSLGVSDGAYIEITSGLSEGDVISAVAPHLDPRKK